MASTIGLLIKLLKPPKGKRAGSFLASIRYAQGRSHDFDRDCVGSAVERKGLRGEFIDSYGVTSSLEAPRQMDAIASQSRAIDDVVHLVLSTGQIIERRTVREIIQTVLGSIGMADGHQYVAYGHDDVEGNYHIHLIGNRTHIETGRAVHMGHTIRKLENCATQINYDRTWRIFPGKHNNGLISRLAKVALAEIEKRGLAAVPDDERRRYNNIFKADRERRERQEGAISQGAIQAAKERGVLPIAHLIGPAVHAAFRVSSSWAEFRDQLARASISMIANVKAGRDGKRYPAVSFGHPGGTGTSGSSLGLKAAALEQKFGAIDQAPDVSPLLLPRERAEVAGAGIVDRAIVDARREAQDRNDRFRADYGQYLSKIRADNRRARVAARSGPKATHLASLATKLEGIKTQRDELRAKIISSLKRGTPDRREKLDFLDRETRRSRKIVRSMEAERWRETCSNIDRDTGTSKPMPYAQWLETQPRGHDRDAELAAVTRRQYVARSNADVGVNGSDRETELLAPSVSKAPADKESTLELRAPRQRAVESETEVSSPAGSEVVIGHSDKIGWEDEARSRSLRHAGHPGASPDSSQGEATPTPPAMQVGSHAKQTDQEPSSGREAKDEPLAATDREQDPVTLPPAQRSARPKDPGRDFRAATRSKTRRVFGRPPRTPVPIVSVPGQDPPLPDPPLPDPLPPDRAMSDDDLFEWLVSVEDLNREADGKGVLRALEAGYTRDTIACVWLILKEPCPPDLPYVQRLLDDARRYQIAKNIVKGMSISEARAAYQEWWSGQGQSKRNRVSRKKKHYKNSGRSR